MTEINKSTDLSERIDRAILIIRGQKVMIDSDLAEIFGVKTKRLNEQVKRNIKRFPKDFMFQLTTQEKKELVANCDHLERLKHSGTNPYAFTLWPLCSLRTLRSMGEEAFRRARAAFSSSLSSTAFCSGFIWRRCDKNLFGTIGV